MTSRQRQWQIKQHKEGRCLICGEKAVNRSHCEYHRRQACILQNARNRQGTKPKTNCSICGKPGHNIRTCKTNNP